jgi:hypothetical protein
VGNFATLFSTLAPSFAAVYRRKLVPPPEPTVSDAAHVYEKATNARRRYSRFGGPEFVDTPRPEIVVIDADAPLVLPFPPTDDEKYLYAQTRRVPLYIFGTLSFLSNAVGFRQAVPRTTGASLLSLPPGFIAVVLIGELHLVLSHLIV